MPISQARLYQVVLAAEFFSSRKQTIEHGVLSTLIGLRRGEISQDEAVANIQAYFLPTPSEGEFRELIAREKEHYRLTSHENQKTKIRKRNQAASSQAGRVYQEKLISQLRGLHQEAEEIPLSAPGNQFPPKESYFPAPQDSFQQKIPQASPKQFQAEPFLVVTKNPPKNSSIDQAEKSRILREAAQIARELEQEEMALQEWARGQVRPEGEEPGRPEGEEPEGGTEGG